MSAPAESLQNIMALSPQEAARLLIDAQDEHPDWLDRFSEQLDRHRSGQALARVLSVWDLSQADAARLFDVSRQAIGKWMHQGVPAERAEAVSDLAAATDVLLHHLKRDRIAAVVRRTASALDDRSLLDLLAGGGSAAVLAACRAMFDFSQAHA